MMDRARIEAMLSDVEARRISVADALQALRDFAFEDLGFAKLDHHRPLRTGLPEVIYSEGKSPAQVADIFWAMAAAGGNVLATRATRGQYDEVERVAPAGSKTTAVYNERARTITLAQCACERGKGSIAILCAGTSDLPVAEEAMVTAGLLGNEVELIADVGVAGIHRLFAHKERLCQARVLIVCAGMEGALPSVVAGLVNAPVIAVPTSIGYGASFHGIAALLGMLNSCAPNVAVVNIDNGFGAACIASTINHQ